MGVGRWDGEMEWGDGDRMGWGDGDRMEWGDEDRMGLWW
jgi:hypothetical protein